LIKRGLLLRQERGDTNCAMEYHILGRVAFGEGNDAEAMAHYQESLRGFQQWYIPLHLAICLEGLAEVVVAQGKPFQAACLLGRAEALWQEIHALRPPVLEARYAATIALLREQLGEPLLLEALRQGQEREPAALLQLSTQNDALTLSSPAHALTIAPAESILAVGSSSPLPEALTKREQEIFRLLAEGLTKPQIAERLTLSFHTVNAHVRTIYAKVGVSSRSAATRYALEHHLA
jgi:ATP/maltotriose-dependent transcriptional regulator MalT